MYVDSREKVTARYQVIDMFKKNKKELLVHSPSYFDNNNRMPSFFSQLICPSKREVMVFGSFKQRGTLLPKAPKGWGWRTALLFDELADLLQNGALRVAAVVQLV